MDISTNISAFINKVLLRGRCVSMHICIYVRHSLMNKFKGNSRGNTFSWLIRVINYDIKAPHGYTAVSNNSACAIIRAAMRTERVFRDCRWLVMLFRQVRATLLNICNSLEPWLGRRAKRPQLIAPHVPVLSALASTDTGTCPEGARWPVRHTVSQASVSHMLTNVSVGNNKLV